jgi:arogenate dehydrogenase (NADP+)
MRLGILGLGLIGGSLGLDLSALGHHVCGVTTRESEAQIAVEIGAAAVAGTDLALLSGCEVVILCVPIPAILPMIERLAEVLDPSVILSDVGSVKASIVLDAEKLWPRFVGGHPMAGTASRGMAAAQRYLFRGRPYVVTPTENTDPHALEVMIDLIKSLEATCIAMDCDTHDRSVARISHLPVFVSAALLLNLGEDLEADQLASSGFFDTSRVGGGNPALGVAMAQGNQAKLLAELRSCRQHLEKLEQAVAESDWQTLTSVLEWSNRRRTQLFPEQG